MADVVKDLRRLVIKAYHMNEVTWGEENKITVPAGSKVTVNLNGKKITTEKADILHPILA